MVFCCVIGCSSNHNNIKERHLHLFRFPKDPKMIEQWLQLSGNTKIKNIKNARMCSSHFSQDCYNKLLIHRLLNYSPPKFRKLHNDAIPSLNLPNANISLNNKDKSSDTSNSTLISSLNLQNTSQISCVSEDMNENDGNIKTTTSFTLANEPEMQSHSEIDEDNEIQSSNSFCILVGEPDVQKQHQLDYLIENVIKVDENPSDLNVPNRIPQSSEMNAQNKPQMECRIEKLVKLNKNLDSISHNALINEVDVQSQSQSISSLHCPLINEHQTQYRFQEVNCETVSSIDITEENLFQNYVLFLPTSKFAETSEQDLHQVISSSSVLTGQQIIAGKIQKKIRKLNKEKEYWKEQAMPSKQGSTMLKKLKQKEENHILTLKNRLNSLQREMDRSKMNQRIKVQQLLRTNKALRQENRVLKAKSREAHKNALAVAALKKVFSAAQIELLTNENKAFIHWTLEDITNALILKRFSSQGYYYLKDKLGFPLPSKTTLARWTNKIIEA